MLHDQMNPEDTPIAKSDGAAPVAEPTSVRKPRLAIMGEFSVGKSTLTNLLIGSDPLPVKVTATQLPPVWISYGDDQAYREDLDGNRFDVDLMALDQVPFEETAVIRIYQKSGILENCDLIDMPGISDPNMSSDVWENMIQYADGVLWCTHATQSWRQSEAAVWKSLPAKLYAKSFLLITRIDKLLSEKDRNKVIGRTSRETKGMFAGVFPISLTQALESQNDPEKWESCGAANFADNLAALLLDLAEPSGGYLAALNEGASSDTDQPATNGRGHTTFRLDVAQAQSNPAPARVVPKRVTRGPLKVRKPPRQPALLLDDSVAVRILAADTSHDRQISD